MLNIKIPETLLFALCLGTSALFAQVSIDGDYGCISGFPVDMGEYALQYLDNLCIANGGYPQMGQINPISNGTVQVCNKCANLCNSYDALEEIQEKQITCEENCGKWSYSCGESSWSYKILGNCDRSKEYNNEYPQCQADSSQSSESGNNSSSSVEQSSSSFNSSSSDEGNCIGLGQICHKSSGAVGGGSSDSGSSSSEGNGRDSSSSSEYGYSSGSGDYPFGESCEIDSYYWNYMAKYGVFHRTLYPLLPYMLKKNEMYVSGCGCSGDQFVYCQIRNFNYVHNYMPSSLQLCNYSHGYWCDGIESGGGTTCDFSGSSAYIYHTDISGYDWLVTSLRDNNLYPLGGQSSFFGVTHESGTPSAWFEQFFTLGFTLPVNVYASDLEAAILSALPEFPSMDKIHAYCRGEWVPHDEDCFGTQSEAYKAMGDSVFVCGSLGGFVGYSLDLSGRGWCVVGGCEFEDEASSSSSGESSSSSSSSGGGCSPYPLSSTPANPLNACFSLGDKCYKCNSDRGSECGNNWLWNSFQPNNVGYWYIEAACDGGSLGGSGLCSAYPMSTPSNPLAACFAKDGKCYKCNPDRGADCGNSWLWNSFNPGNVGYWYIEAACDGGSAGGSSSSSSGGCAPYPLLSTPSDPLNACFATNGKCYKCNTDRGSECSYSWLWNSFQPNNVGYWYKEIACGGDSGESDGCPESAFLQKKSMLEKDSEYAKEDISYEVWGKNTKFFYDALGRKTQVDPKIRRVLFSPKKNKSTLQDANNNFWLEGTYTTRCYKNSRGEWVCTDISQLSVLRKNGDECGIEGVDYGIIEADGSKTGGITCPYVDFKSGYITEYEELGTCSDGSRRLEVVIDITITPNLTRNEIFYIKKGYIFPNSNYIAAEQDEIAMYYHELGHQKYNECLEFPVITKRTFVGCYCQTAGINNKIKSDAEKAMSLEEEKASKIYKNMLDAAKNSFHDKYGKNGYATTYECPN